MKIEIFSDFGGIWGKACSHFMQWAERQHPRQGLEFAPIDKALERMPIHIVGHHNGKIKAIAIFDLRQYWIFSSV